MKKETLFIYSCKECDEEFLANTSDIDDCPCCGEEFHPNAIYGEYEVEIGEVKLYSKELSECETVSEFHYYEIHVFFGRSDGYSSFFKSTEKLDGEEEIIEKAIKLFPDFKNDCGNCDYAQEIDKEEYYNAKGYGLNEAYELYKLDWCKERGYKLSKVDEEIGINGECYSCQDEFEDNEFQDVEYIEKLFLDDLNDTLSKGRNK